jgi:hypothetical protein
MSETRLLAQVDLSVWWILLTIFVVVVLPFILGTLIARALGLKDMAVRMGIVLFSLFLGMAPFVWQGVVGWLEQRQYREHLATWEKREERFAVTEKGLEDLKLAQPSLTVQQ